VAGGVRLGTARGQGHAAKGGTTGGCGPGAAWSRPSAAGRARGQGGARPRPSAAGRGTAGTERDRGGLGREGRGLGAASIPGAARLGGRTS
jgi:hypothetical protein